MGATSWDGEADGRVGHGSQMLAQTIGCELLHASVGQADVARVVMNVACPTSLGGGPERPEETIAQRAARDVAVTTENLLWIILVRIESDEVA